jgi:hypothetical protein
MFSTRQVNLLNKVLRLGDSRRANIAANISRQYGGMSQKQQQMLEEMVVEIGAERSADIVMR